MLPIQDIEGLLRHYDFIFVVLLSLIIVIVPPILSFILSMQFCKHYKGPGAFAFLIIMISSFSVLTLLSYAYYLHNKDKVCVVPGVDEMPYVLLVLIVFPAFIGSLIGLVRNELSIEE